MLSLILAVASNNVIGNNLKIPWYLPEDLKRFKKLTTGKKIIMGRKTYDSLPKLLPNRTHIVLTKDINYKNNNVEIINSIEELKKYIASKEEVMVIGGAQIYKLLLPHAKKIYLTRIKKAFEGNIFFKFDESKWIITNCENHRNEKFEYSYINYDKKTIYTIK
jgi:dihydrofolate reductase